MTAATTVHAAHQDRSGQVLGKCSFPILLNVHPISGPEMLRHVVNYLS